MKLIRTHEQAKSNHPNAVNNHHDPIPVCSFENRDNKNEKRHPKSIKFKVYHPKMMIVYNSRKVEK